MDRVVAKTSMDIVEHNIQQLKELFPEIFSEDKIDFVRLKELLGDYTATDEDHYSFTWHGKRKANHLAQTPSTGTLRPCKQESVDWDKTQNLFIEGDNLEVLKLLQKSYHRKIKMIYIDPPYNTGNDFVYPDDFKDGVRNYLEMTGQVDTEGKKLGTNSSAAGRYHTNWLNMMYPRLKLARNLLRDDGVIFMSIDDNEMANLRKVCDEVFGEENFVTNFVWKSRVSEDNRKQTGVSTDHEYVICYRKSESSILKGTDKDLTKFNNLDNDSRGPWRSADLTGLLPKEQRPNCHYDLVNPETSIKYPCPPKGWRYEPATMNKKISEGRILWPDSETGRPRLKLFQNEMISFTKNISSLITETHTGEGTKELNNLVGAGVFQFPKPRRLLEILMSQMLEANDIVLDFFAGSATTSDALLQINIEKGLSTRFILIQLPEKLDKKSAAFTAGFKNIAEISKERIRRAAKKIKEENPSYEGDLGFKVFKLDTSNIKAWDAGFDTLEKDLISAVDYIKQDRSDEDVLFELLLKYGLDLTVPIETRTIANKTIQIIDQGSLVVCLDKDISLEVVNSIGALKAELQSQMMRVIFKDSAFKDDVLKANTIQTLKRFGIEDIKSL